MKINVWPNEFRKYFVVKKSKSVQYINFNKIYLQGYQIMQVKVSASGFANLSAIHI